MKNTKIVCTLGPASDDPETLDALIAAGMDVARLNFSHGDHDGHAATLGRVREAAKRAGREVAILQDLQGPKIRVGKLEGGAMELTKGQLVAIVPAEDQPDPETIPTTYEGLPGDVRGFGARGEGARDHRLEHLGGGDDELAAEVGLFDAPLLNEGLSLIHI